MRDCFRQLPQPMQADREIVMRKRAVRLLAQDVSIMLNRSQVATGRRTCRTCALRPPHQKTYKDRGMFAPPTGTITFLFTDIQGSTRLWEQHPEAMQTALDRHNLLVREAIEAGPATIGPAAEEAA